MDEDEEGMKILWELWKFDSFSPLKNGLNIFVSNMDRKLISEKTKNGRISKKDLDDREREMVRKMVSRGVLTDCPKDDRFLVKA